MPIWSARCATPRSKSALLKLMLLPLVIVSAGCATPSRPSLPPSVVEPPAIPALPQAARQTDSPKFSASVSADFERWQRLLTEPSSPEEPAKPATTP